MLMTPPQGNQPRISSNVSRLEISTDAGQCHVGYQSCFYRALKPVSKTDLEFIAEKVYDPKAAYKKE